MVWSPGIRLMPVKVSSELPLTKYLVVTGGTVSGLGKGTTISSIGVVLKDAGLRVTCIKIDPYLNVDAGTMSPYEHGEVFVLEDGGEVDLDLGNYERFLDVKLTRDHNITTGKIFERVIRFEREGKYLGKTVQLVPHITNAVQVWIQEVSRRPVDGSELPPDICLIEVGGTVGDIESGVYLEALQQFGSHVGYENFCLCHLSFVPVLGSVGEQKTKPTQHSVKELRMAGLKPDFIFCRSDNPVSSSAKAKIALFGQVNVANVISVHDVSNVYHVPQMIASQGFVSLICKRLNFSSLPSTLPCSWLRVWNFLAMRVDRTNDDVTIGVVGKYTGLVDSYLSVIKALRHAAIEMGVGLNVTFVESSDLEEEAAQLLPAKYERAWTTLKTADGVLCPGGFGDRGILGKAASARYCRYANKPYLGICLGMQTAVIDLCRELDFKNANSEEFDAQSEHKVVIYMPEIDTSLMGGNMRLGIRSTTIIDKESLTYQLYDHRTSIQERHRHRYEVNPKYVPAMEAAGLNFVGADGDRMEIAELKGHSFFLCTQFHPEFTSRPLQPNPCFLGFLLASKGRLTERLHANGGKLLAGGFYKSESFFNADKNIVVSNPAVKGDLAGGISTVYGENKMQDDKENGGLC